jgi:hypothetical protein
MNLSEQFWLSIAVEAIIGVATIAMMKQQLKDTVARVNSLESDQKDLQNRHTDHEGRISHVEGQLGVLRKSKGE